MMRKVEIIPNLVALHTNVNFIPYFSFVEGIKYIPYAIKSENQKFHIYYILSKKIFSEIKRNPVLFTRENFYYGKDILIENINSKNYIFFNKKFGLNFRILIQIEKDKLKFIVDPLYHYVVKFKIENLLPPGYILRDFLYIFLLKNGYLTIHSSACSFDNDGFLFVAPADTGKSFIIKKLVENLDAFYLSEDLTIYDSNNSELYSVPYTSTLNHEILKERFKFILPFATLYYYNKPQPPAVLVFKNKFKEKAKIKYLVLLRRSYRNKITIIKNNRQFLNKKAKEYVKVFLYTLNKEEFPIFNNKIAVSYLLIEKFDLVKAEKKLITNLIDSVQNIFLIEGQKPSVFLELLKSKIL